LILVLLYKNAGPFAKSMPYTNDRKSIPYGTWRLSKKHRAEGVILLL
jgi:hypothetical protein